MEIVLLGMALIAGTILYVSLCAAAVLLVLGIFELISPLPKPTFPTLMLFAGITIMLIVGYQLTTIATEEDEVIRIDDSYTGETPCYVSNGHEYCTGLIP